MRAAGVRRFNGAVELLALPDPRPPRPDEVLIDVFAAGVGNWDDIARSGGWELGVPPPLALGVQAAGVVTAVGDEAREPQVGARVLTHSLPLREQGAWAEQFIAAAEHLVVLPENVPFDVAAALPVPGLTAEQTLGVLDIRAGEQLLVHGAGGVTGSLLVRLGVLRGAEVIATAGPRSTARVRDLGAAVVLDHGEGHWVDRVHELSGGAGVPTAVNAAPSGARYALRAVRDGGRLATITSDPPAAERDIAVHTVYVRPDGAMLGRLADLCGRGAIGVLLGRPYRLEQAPAALARVLEGTGGRAIVLALG